MSHPAHLNHKGFSLVEMAIVMAIVGLLMAGLLPMISGQIEQQHRSETRKAMEEIRNALVGFATSQTPPRLPCPATPSLATGTVGAGVENCAISTGVLPWVTLGTSETDAWQRRFTYSVASSVTGTFGTSFTLTSVGNLNVLSVAAGTAVASGVPAVLVSHGVDGAGAYTPQGSQLNASADLDQVDNSNGGLTFVSHEQSQTFDDHVVWISPHTLFNRMVAAGKLPY
ncbi:MAG: type II secretion system protein [Nitrosomonadales bacterium]|nr:type II secretion system protein [Nitrosomonadales bacterium]